MYCIEQWVGNVAFYRVLKYSDDRIRELCSEAIAETDRAKLDVVLSELRAAVHERIEELRVMAQEIARLDTRSKAAD